MANIEKFLAVYKAMLERARAKHPEMYVWALADLDVVHGRMAAAIKRGTFNKDSLAFVWTCRELGIKHTYKAIREFLEADMVKKAENLDTSDRHVKILAKM